MNIKLICIAYLETIEVSSSSKAQIDRLLEENERLRREIMDLRELQHQVFYN